ncbi:zinc-binding dehydrogenase [Streptomyces sp. NPDC051704]|uniref:zinc-binding dehydrogenase n=1 Tax=Streptomyces sp. NPDC051704 TaxID=3365671 RepID=UPI0037BABEAD
MIDAVGGDYGQRSLKVLKPGGHLVTLPGPDGIPADTQGVHAAWVLVEPDLKGLQEIASLADRGLLKPLVDTVLPLEQAAKAHEIGELGRTTGKIVLTATTTPTTTRSAPAPGSRSPSAWSAPAATAAGSARAAARACCESPGATTTPLTARLTPGCEGAAECPRMSC